MVKLGLRILKSKLKNIFKKNIISSFPFYFTLGLPALPESMYRKDIKSKRCINYFRQCTMFFLVAFLNGNGFCGFTPILCKNAKNEFHNTHRKPAIFLYHFGSATDNSISASFEWLTINVNNLLIFEELKHTLKLLIFIPVYSHSHSRMVYSGPLILRRKRLANLKFPRQF